MGLATDVVVALVQVVMSFSISTLFVLYQLSFRKHFEFGNEEVMSKFYSQALQLKSYYVLTVAFRIFMTIFKVIQAIPLPLHPHLL
jgi:hypothetical protein